jgi:hypothetical protein
MQGQANISTANHMAADPKARALHDKLIDGNGKPRVFDDVRIAAFSQATKDNDSVKAGPLTFGFGGDLTKEDVCGPELAFGVTMHEIVKEPILLIKTSWGGKSIACDFRPPSAGPLHTDEEAKVIAERESQNAKASDVAITAESVQERTGHYYRLMNEHVKTVLADPGKYHPAYNKAQGYQIAGFVWFQGWNDMVDNNIYPKRYEPGGYDNYTKVMKLFIEDVRKDFKAPAMPFVIGVLGVGGPTELFKSPRYQPVYRNFRDAMVAAAEDPKLKETVKAVLTEKFWPHDVEDADIKAKEIDEEAKKALTEEQAKNPKLQGRGAWEWQQKFAAKVREEKMTPEERLALSGRSNVGFHYMGSMKFYSQAGEAFAKTLPGIGK